MPICSSLQAHVGSEHVAEPRGCDGCGSVGNRGHPRPPLWVDQSYEGGLLYTDRLKLTPVSNARCPLAQALCE